MSLLKTYADESQEFIAEILESFDEKIFDMSNMSAVQSVLQETQEFLELIQPEVCTYTEEFFLQPLFNLSNLLHEVEESLVGNVNDEFPYLLDLLVSSLTYLNFMQKSFRCKDAPLRFQDATVESLCKLFVQTVFARQYVASEEYCAQFRAFFEIDMDLRCRNVDVSLTKNLFRYVNKFLRSFDERLILRHCYVHEFDQKIHLPEIQLKLRSLTEVLAFLARLEAKRKSCLLRSNPSGQPPVAPQAIQKTGYQEFSVSVVFLAQLSEEQARNYLGVESYNGKLRQYQYVQKIANGKYEPFRPRLLNQRYEQQDALINSEMTVNATNFIVRRYIVKEAIRVLKQQQISQQSALKFYKYESANFDKFLLQYAELLLQKTIDKNIQKMNINQIIRNIIVSTEIQDDFPKKNYNKKDIVLLAIEAFKNIISIVIQTTFMCYNEKEEEISRFTGQIQPLGGESTELCIEMLENLAVEFEQFEPFELGIKQAQYIIFDLINAKDNYSESKLVNISFISDIEECDAKEQDYFAKIVDVLPEICQKFVEQEVMLDKQLAITTAYTLCEQRCAPGQPPLTVQKPNLKLLASLPVVDPHCCLLSAPHSGAKTLLSLLVGQPILRQANIIETLSTENTPYKQDILLKSESKPWDFLYVISQQSKKTAQIVQSEDDIVSIGSWLSMDSQALQSKIQKDATDAAGTGGAPGAAGAPDATATILAQFLSKLKSDDEAPRSPVCGDEAGREAWEVGSAPARSPSLAFKSNLKYIQQLAQIPGQLFGQSAQQSFRGKQISVTGERRQVPAQKFTKNEQIDHCGVIAKSVELVPARAAQRVEFALVPELLTGELRDRGLSAAVDALRCQMAGLERAQQQALEALALQRTQFQQYYQALYAIFKRPQLPQQFLQPQLAHFQQLLGGQKQLNKGAVVALLSVLQQQRHQCEQESEKAQQSQLQFQQQLQQLQLSEQLTAEVEGRYSRSIQQFQKQREQYLQIQQYVDKEQQIVLKVQQSYDSIMQTSVQINGYKQEGQIYTQEIAKYVISDEQIKKTWQLIQGRVVLFVYDCTGGENQRITQELCQKLAGMQVIFVCNKIDLYNRYGCFATIEHNIEMCQKHNFEHVFVSALEKQQIWALKTTILLCLAKEIKITEEDRLYDK